MGHSTSTALSVDVSASRIKPRDEEAILKPIHRLVQSGNLQAALHECQLLLQEHPKQASVWHQVATLSLQLANPREAARYLQQAIQIDPAQPEFHRSLAVACQQQGDSAAAVTSLERYLRLRPLDASGWVMLSEVLFLAGELTVSLDCLRQAFQLEPGNLQARLLLANIQKQLGDIETAIGHYKEVLNYDPCNVPAAVNLASALRGQGKTAEAIPWLKGALSAEGTSPLIHFNYANALVDVGEFAEARAHYRIALRSHPQPAKVFFNLTAITRFRPDQRNSLREMESLIRKNLATREDQIHYHFGMGKALDDSCEFDAAFHHYQQGNNLVAVQFDPAFQKEEFERWTGCWTESFLKEREDWGSVPHESPTPIFIVGMPRSGTTLVEQMLSRLPGVQPLGERTRMGELVEEHTASLSCQQEPVWAAQRMTQADLHQMAQDYLTGIPSHPAATFFTDKLPGNFMLLGWIALCFPQALIVHCSRDPRDTCLSCYFQHFTARIPWSYNLSHLAACYRNYEFLMAHWQRVLPTRIHHICYEELIEDPEGNLKQLERLITLRSPHQQIVSSGHQRIIQTASAWQARQPVYQHARQRWRHYQQHIDPLLQVFGDQLQPVRYDREDRTPGPDASI